VAVRVQREDFDVGAEITAMARGDHGIGGIASFLGVVRADKVAGGEAVADGAGVAAMTLEHYPGMTERQLAAIEAEARARWPLAASLIVHRYGRLEPGDNIVLVVCASAHRGVLRLRIPGRLAEDQGAVLEAGGDRPGRALGQGPGRGQRCGGAVAARVATCLPVSAYHRMELARACSSGEGCRKEIDHDGG
jgi:molybdopterin synthase catalytic subunit